MRRIVFLFILLLSPSLAEAGPLIDKLQGIIYRDIKGGFDDGEDYWSEDTFELIKIDESRAFIRYALHFYNGQVCNLSGIAEESEGKLYYIEPAPQTPPACSLTLELKDRNLLSYETSDYSEGQPLGGCRAYCSPRGSFDDAIFRLRSRKLFYPARISSIKRSKEYTDAAAAYEAWKNVELPKEKPPVKKSNKRTKKN